MQEGVTPLRKQKGTMKYKNTFQAGVLQDEAFEHLPAEGGVSVHGGVPKTSMAALAEQGQWRGIPMPGPSLIPEGMIRMVSVPWLMEYVADSLLEDKRIEDNSSLTEVMAAGAQIPPIHVSIHENGLVTLHDGHHRLVVADELGWPEIRAVVEGDLPTAVKCTATTKKGNPCKAYAVKDSVLCVGHNK